MSTRTGPLTVILIALSVVVAIWTGLGKNHEAVSHLYLTNSNEGFTVPEISHGQVWRLITPIFLHFGIMHLVFNMLWLNDLGTVIEKVSGTPSFLEIVLATGIISNFAQFAFHGPYFGGMSGVVYGLFGYVWMKSKFDPACGIRLANNTIMWMIGWFVLCLTKVMGPVANYAHGVGLLVGMAWGFAAAKQSPTRSHEGTSFPE